MVWLAVLKLRPNFWLANASFWDSLRSVTTSPHVLHPNLARIMADPKLQGHKAPRKCCCHPIILYITVKPLC